MTKYESRYGERRSDVACRAAFYRSSCGASSGARGQAHRSAVEVDRARATSRPPGAFVLAPVPPLEHGHADLVVPDPPAAAVHGQGLAVEAPAGGVVPVGARRVPGDRGAPPTARRCSAASPCSRPASRWCCSPRASASRARRCSRCSTARPTWPLEGRGADRARRHRRLGAGACREGPSSSTRARWSRRSSASRSPRPRSRRAGGCPRSAVRGATADELRTALQELFDEAQRRAGTPNT